jgi:hypothetical protein
MLLHQVLLSPVAKVEPTASDEMMEDVQVAHVVM